MRLTVLIVDDHEEFRASARALLEADGFHVVGEAADGSQAIAGTHALHPDIVLLDIQLPDTDGFTLAERLASHTDPPAVVLVSSRDAGAYATSLSASSARGFIAKAELSGNALAKLIE